MIGCIIRGLFGRSGIFLNRVHLNYLAVPFGRGVSCRFSPVPPEIRFRAVSWDFAAESVAWRGGDHLQVVDAEDNVHDLTQLELLQVGAFEQEVLIVQTTKAISSALPTKSHETT
jgi:hypothetical protein